jgi:hypothetical protein
MRKASEFDKKHGCIYAVLRIFRDSSRRVTLKTHQTLELAQAHCRDPETSSSTCTTKEGKARTRRYGPWFECYEYMPGCRPKEGQ